MQRSPNETKAHENLIDTFRQLQRSLSIRIECINVNIQYRSLLCLHTFIHFWLTKCSVSVQTYQLHFRALLFCFICVFRPEPLHFSVRVYPIRSSVLSFSTLPLLYFSSVHLMFTNIYKYKMNLTKI